MTTRVQHRTDETDLCPRCSTPLTEHRNRDCWPRCGKPNPDDLTELCSLPERHAELLNCPPCAYDVPTGSTPASGASHAEGVEVVTDHKHEWQPNGTADRDRVQKSPCSALDDFLWTDVLSLAVCRCGAVQRNIVARKNARRRGDDLRKQR